MNEQRNAGTFRACVSRLRMRNIAVNFVGKQDPRKPKLGAIAGMNRARTRKK